MISVSHYRRGDSKGNRDFKSQEGETKR